MHAPGLRRPGYVSHAGEIDSDGVCRGGATGDVVCEEQQDGRGGNIPACEGPWADRSGEIQFNENGMGQGLLPRRVVWRGREKREPDLRMAQEVCNRAKERQNRRLNHRHIMRVSMMPVFAIQVLGEDGVEDAAMVMTGYTMMLMRIRVDMDQWDRDHPEDQPEDRNNAKPTHVQPRLCSETLDSHY